MSDDEHLATELRLAKAYRAEAEQIKKAAEQDRAAAEYERGQSEHRLRAAADNERSAAERVRWLEQHGEAEVRAIVAAAEAKLAEAKALLAEFNNTKHEAAKALVAINEREARAAAAREQLAAA